MRTLVITGLGKLASCSRVSELTKVLSVAKLVKGEESSLKILETVVGRTNFADGSLTLVANTTLEFKMLDIKSQLLRTPIITIFRNL